MSRPAVILLTPVKNEAWILERFLRAASLWADHIVVADQKSDDGSKDIAARFPNVTLLHNDTDGWSEVVRQNMLIAAARAIPAERRLLVALDADEFLTANFATSPEWARVLAAEPGTRVCFRWVNVLPGVAEGWTPAEEKWFAVMDDGAEHRPELIHGPRLPMRPDAPALYLDEVRVLHYQYTDWARMESKQRWYQAWEHLTYPQKRAVTIFRQYHHMHGRDDARPLDPAWLAGYARAGLDMRTVERQPSYRWDAEVLGYLAEHGPARFRRTALWDADWTALNAALGVAPGRAFPDPRTVFEKRVHAWLSKTQPHADTLPVRAVQKALQPLGW